ncbi:MAG: cache domain-containing protein, partial [Methanomicrobiaceae archaeon]|nr:cache domain-containing protein [Methanomicrobiaceae archaeon]
VAFVEKAYVYAREQGKEAALSEFNNRDGGFVDGELYIFAYDLEGNTLALPFQPDLLGKNRWNARDVNGIFVIQEIIHAAKSGGGFVQYSYPDPEDRVVEPKISFVMMVDRSWVIGAGIYREGENDPFVRSGRDPGVRGALKSYVEEAIAYAREHGKTAAIREFNNQSGKFVRGNDYIYAYDYEGITLALPFQPELIGTNLSGLQDAFGVRTNWIQCLMARQGGGFVFLHWHNPAHKMAIEPKLCYASPVDDAWWLGAGVYLSDQ